jgi:chemotaxis family two-component system response regulator Rcp1
MPSAPIIDLGRPVQILLAEDNPGEVRLVQEVMRESRFPNEVHAVSDGVETMAYVHQSGKYAGAPRPDIVLLDLNMPKKDGRQVLRELKGDPDLRRIPVVIMTSSLAPADIEVAYAEHANCYVRKPVDFHQFQAMIRQIETFWFATVEIPDH